MKLSVLQIPLTAGISLNFRWQTEAESNRQTDLIPKRIYNNGDRSWGLREGGGAVLFNKTGRQNRGQTHQSSSPSVNVKRMQTTLICCHHIHERGPGDDDKSVHIFSLCVCVWASRLMRTCGRFFVCTCSLYMRNHKNHVDIGLYINSAWCGTSVCSFLPVHLSICVCVCYHIIPHIDLMSA